MGVLKHRAHRVHGEGEAAERKQPGERKVGGEQPGERKAGRDRGVG